VLYREPKLLKAFLLSLLIRYWQFVSVLYREPKLLKAGIVRAATVDCSSFSALP